MPRAIRRARLGSHMGLTRLAEHGRTQDPMEAREGNNQIFCAWEMRAFPESQFRRDPEYGLVHDHVGEDVPKHTSSGLLLLGEDGAESFWTLPSESAARSA